jgi:hypothetical protein
LSRALDAVLKTATGGDVYYTDPTGQRKLAPQSRGTLGKTLIAATLAGLLSKDEYRQTPYGPVRDFTGTAGNAMAASQAKVNEMRNRPQKLSDEAQARKLMTIQNNSNLIALQSASARLKHENQKDNAEAVATGLAPFQEYESLRTANNDPNQPKAFMAQGLSHDQVLAVGPDGKPAHKLSDSNVIQDGWTSKWNDATQQMEPEPTYAVLNPDLKDITLPPQVTEMLNKVNSQWKNIHAIVGGTVKVPVSSYVSAMHDYSAVMQGQQVLNTLNKTVNGGDAKPLSVDAVAAAARAGRDKGTNILPALYQLTHAVAGNNLPEDGQRPDNLLHTLLTSPNGSEILKLIGLTPEQASQKADEISNQRISATALAKEGGMGEKAPAAQEKISSVTGNINTNADLNPDDRKMLLGNVPAPDKDGIIHMTNGQLEKLDNNFREVVATNKGIAEKNALANGDPVQLQKTASNVIEGDVANLAKVVTFRGNARDNTYNAIHDEAAKRGLDTTQYGQQALENKANMLADYSSNKKSSTGAQMTSFNAFLGHTAGAVDAEKRLEGKTFGLTRTPVINGAMDVIGKQLADDPDWIAYKTSLIPVQTEISNFLAAGYAVKAEDAALMQKAVDPHETPARITSSLKQLAETADIRLASMAQKYLDTMGTTYPNMLSADSLNTLKRLGIQSKTAPLSTPLPRGWKNNQFSTMTDPKMAQAYVLAAGRDPKRAQDLAKENGWILQ